MSVSLLDRLITTGDPDTLALVLHLPATVLTFLLLGYRVARDERAFTAGMLRAPERRSLKTLVANPPAGVSVRLSGTMRPA